MQASRDETRRAVNRFALFGNVPRDQPRSPCDRIYHVIQPMSPRIHSRHKPRPLKHTLSDAPLRPRVWPNSFRWMLSGYIVVSLVLFSASLYHSYYAALFTRLQSTKPHSPALSGIDFLSPAARLDKLVYLHPRPIHFGPFTYRPVVNPHSHEVTACLWTTESDLDWVPSWTNDWLGNASACGLSISYIVNRSDLCRRGDAFAPSDDPCSSSRVYTSSPPSQA
jgi:hypothetical protein